ncbi:MAG: pirin family protein [Vallitaleaceae bacterium]|nr:pirin family protein [Vallitaleaceae bacterium]
MSKIKSSFLAKRTKDEMGFYLNRIFGHEEAAEFDPFLLLDYVEGNSDEVKKGYPWHPHKGIETVTYLTKGSATHKDSLGHDGELNPFDVEWITAGKGIYHQMIPKTVDPSIEGFKLWINMPAIRKGQDPAYQAFKMGDLKHINKDGKHVRLISGSYEDETGPVEKSDLDVLLMDVELWQDNHIQIMRNPMKNGFIFIYQGYGVINEEDYINPLMAYNLESGILDIRSTSSESLRFIFAEAYPVDEPIAWKGPIVMNTYKELVETFKDIEMDRFI